MKKYEYMKLEDVPNSSVTFDISDINSLGEDGWRMIQMMYSDDGYGYAILEREQ